MLFIDVQLFTMHLMDRTRSFARKTLLAGAIVVTGCAPTPQPFGEQPVEVRRAVELPSSYVPGVEWDISNDYARLLAGMPGGANSPFRSFRESPAWQDHRWKMDQLWKRVERQRLSKIRSWRQAELGTLTNYPLVFYPFSGPDTLFADAFFPGARTYILCGLETAELMPDFNALSEGERNDVLVGLQETMTTVLNYSYFITKDMRVDLQRTRMRGVLPVMSVFLARSGHRITSVEAIALSSNGTVVKGIQGLRISCIERRGGKPKTYFYFREDLGNGNLRRDRSLLNFVSGHGSPVTYLKSASYLLHESHFSSIRGAILNRSVAILQDDSGVPLRYLDAEKWRLNFYGNYSGVLDIFQKYYQNDLIAVYQRGGANVRPMSFGVGYKFNPKETALILARRK